MKPYAVDVSWVAVVMADDPENASDVARRNLSEITRWDSPELSIGRPIKSIADLCAIGWDGQCLPYGGGGNTRLSEIIEALEPEPERDTRTIDMFGPAS
jgi:hypothetical protein